MRISMRDMTPNESKGSHLLDRVPRKVDPMRRAAFVPSSALDWSEVVEVDERSLAKR